MKIFKATFAGHTYDCEWTSWLKVYVLVSNRVPYLTLEPVIIAFINISVAIFNEH